jgi:hypothetical protein
MSYVKVNDNLFVVQQSVKNDKVVEVRKSVNHIWIYDRSGSMYGLLKDLTAQLIKLSKQIPKGDTLTLGWFSGQGQYNFIVKGFKISEDSDYAVLENAIKKNSDTVGLTCFSEILSNVKTVISDLSVYSTTFSMNFFTDGYPCGVNMNTETTAIFEAIKGIKGSIDSAMFVGYGYYYNKELMTKMAEKLGAMLIHSSMVSEYSDNIVRLLELSGSSSPKQEILPSVENPLAVFTITEQGVVVLSVDDETKMVYVSPQGARTEVYYVSTTPPDDNCIIEIGAISPNEDWATACYASALVLTQQTKTDVALEIMGKFGDKRVVDDITNAFTIDEYGRVEGNIEKAIASDKDRFKSGRDTKYLPPVDAFCVFDVLGKLMEDDEASFYPYNKGFVYNKVSKPTAVNDDYAKFVAPDTVPCIMDDLVWHESRLNLSVRAIIHGTIDLKDKDGVTASSVGLTDNYPVFVYRNYTFIKDGIVNVKKFYVSTSPETKQYFVDKGIVIDDGDDFDCDGVYGLDISNLPAINRAMANGNTSAKAMCTLLKRETEITGELKALKNFLKVEFDNASSVETKLISEQQKAFLEANGVDVDKGGVYSPKVDAVESTDMYIAKKFEIKIKGLSSLPSVNAVMKKLTEGKKRTLSESVVEVGITKYDVFKASNDDEDMRKLWLNKEIAKLKAELKGIRPNIQKSKFAIILGKKWFDEFENRSDNVLEQDGWQFTFALGEETVAI